MKELMENGPVQGECPHPGLVEVGVYLRLGTVAQAVCTTLSSNVVRPGMRHVPSSQAGPGVVQGEVLVAGHVEEDQVLC